MLLGARSEIGRALAMRLVRDNWHVETWSRGNPFPWAMDDESRVHRGASVSDWNLCLIPIGQVAPVGHWWEQDEAAWKECVNSNVLLPVQLLRRIWPQHKPGAAVCFFAGSNPQRVMPGYSAYATGKMALLKAVEHMDAETPDAKMFALGPGTVLTKIHDATRKAHWPNPVLMMTESVGQDRRYKMDRIYECLMWCLEQPKDVIGGRNLCVSDPWDCGWLGEHLRRFPDEYKLRRVE